MATSRFVETVQAAAVPVGAVREQDVAEASPPAVERWYLPGAARILIRCGDGRAMAQIGERLASPLAPLSLAGPTSMPLRIRHDGDAAVAVVPLEPVDWLRLTGMAAATAANRIVPHDLLSQATVLDALAELSGEVRDVAARAHPVLARYRATGRAAHDPLVARLATAIDAGEGVNAGELAAAFGVSREALGRLALRHFGFSTKSLLMRHRFLRALGRVRAVGLRTAAEEAGYRGAPHLLRDANLFLGTTPRRFLDRTRVA